MRGRGSDCGGLGPKPRPSDTRYLHLLSAHEGIASWASALREVAHLARDSRRIIVEPCVRAGAIVPCSPGDVADVSDGRCQLHDRAALTGGSDPLALPRFASDCGASPPLGMPRDTRRVWPMRAYVDIAALLGDEGLSDVPIISFSEWLDRSVAGVDHLYIAGANATPGGAMPHGAVNASLPYILRPAVPGGRGESPYRIDVPLMHCFPRYSGRLCGPPVAPERRKLVGPFAFAESVMFSPPTNGNTKKPPIDNQGARYFDGAELSSSTWAKSRDMFLAGYSRRGYPVAAARVHDARLPPFNALHSVAVSRWLQRAGWSKAVGASPSSYSSYAVVQWRTETVPAEALSGCAAHLARTLARLLPQLPPGKALKHRAQAPRAVLVMDIPSAGMPCRAWRDYGDSGGRRHAAAAAVIDALPLRRYAWSHVDKTQLDSGVVAIREAILAVHAKWYLSCPGRSGSDGFDDGRAPVATSAACKRCFFWSRFVAAVQRARAEAGRPSNLNVFHAHPETVEPKLRDAAPHPGLRTEHTRRAGTRPPRAVSGRRPSSAALAVSPAPPSPVRRYKFKDAYGSTPSAARSAGGARATLHTTEDAARDQPPRRALMAR